ncbi:MAG: proteinase inhibitor I4 serpin, partial [Geobacter sp.]
RGTSGLYYDPIEEDPRHAEVFSKIDAEVNEALGITTKGGGRGYIHVIWETKKRLLKHKYNIDWRTPAELNPHVMFD